jgi:cobalt-zinc-cadmium efflux system protein
MLGVENNRGMAHHDHHRGHSHNHEHGHDRPVHSGFGLGGHGHDHGPVSHDRAFAIGIALNIGFVAVEAYYGWKINSLALLADAGHNLGDVAGLLLAWAGAFAGRFLPDARHTYGWRRASILAAFFNALLLLVAMGSLAWEAVQRLQAIGLHGMSAQANSSHAVTMMVVAGFGIVINGATAWLFMRGSKDDINLRGAYLHMLGDALVSLGVVVAGALTLVFAWAWLDPAVSLVVAGVLVLSTWRLFRQSLHLMFDGVPDHVDLKSVRATLMSLPGVAAVDDLHVWAMGATQTALTAHLVVPEAEHSDDFLRFAVKQLQEGYGIRHITLQVVREPMGLGCGPLR